MDKNMQLQMLNESLQHCRKSSFYKDRIPEAPLKALEELKYLPITTKADLRANSPFGLICVPQEELFQYHESFGTTGTPTSVWLTKNDFLDLADSVNIGGINFNESDVVLVRFPYAISGVAHFVHAAAQQRNACVIPASSRTTVSPYTRMVNLLQKLHVTVLAGLPLQAVLIAETAEMLGLDPRKDFPYLRTLYTAGETLTPQKRKLLENIWGVPVSDNYGLTETGAAVIDCEYCRPHPIENKFIYEILDENLEKEVTIGEPGYLVVTTLTRRGTPLVRYQTGDRVRQVPVNCPCGKHMTIEVRGRMQDLIKIGQCCFDQWDLSEIIEHLPCRRFWVAGPVNGGLGIVVEQERPDDAISCDLEDMLSEKYGIGLNIEVVKKGDLFDRSKLLLVDEVGKPKYIYTEGEMHIKAYLNTPKD